MTIPACDPKAVSYSGLHSEDAAPASSVKDPRQVKTDRALEAALLRLLGVKPLDQITILEVCAEAGIHKTTFFRRYASKQALLDQIAAEQIDNLVRLALPLGHNIAGMTAVCHYVDAHWTLWKALLTGGAGGAMRAQLLATSRRLAAESNQKPTWLPVELSTTCTVTLIVETLSWWLAQTRGDYAIETVSGILLRLVTGAGLPTQEVDQRP